MSSLTGPHRARPHRLYQCDHRRAAHSEQLTTLNLSHCSHVNAEGLRAVRRLTALTTLDLSWCRSVTAAVKQALRTTLPIPSLTITS